MRPLSDIALSAIEAARERIRDAVSPTPLVRLAHGPTAADADIYLKLENLHPIGSFKLRGATNALSCAPADAIADGVYTASAGNMAQGLAWAARERGVSCRAVVPDHAPRAKLDAIRRLGAQVRPVPFGEWWRTMIDHGHPDERGYFVHPVSHPDVIAGNGTIGLEILDALPGVDAIVVPYGGGGLSCGIASAVRHRVPAPRVYAAEVETAAPFAAALRAGAPVRIDYRRSFVDGIGASSVLDEMWPLAARRLADSLVVSTAEIAEAIRHLVTHARVVAEGAGAASVAAALSGRAGAGTIACVVSGGNIDAGVLASILSGDVPEPA